MASAKTLLHYGALLRDVGKIIRRESSAQEPHGELGAKFIVEEVAPHNELFAGHDAQSIAEQIRYRGADELASAPGVADDSLAYITCFASSISADAGDDEDSPDAANADVRLHRIFNTLDNRHDHNVIEHEDYSVLRERLRNGLARIGITAKEENSLLGLLESVASAIPASTREQGLVDVSLYDHAKTTAGIAACVYEYLSERGAENYRAALFDHGTTDDPNAMPIFLMYSCDMSGIQDFIYNISGDGALKQLRARSMYLELLLEHIVDELLERLGLNRANLLYTGGGHAYLLLPNTARTESMLREFHEELTSWFIDQYRTDLYVASAWVACSADDLANRGDQERYRGLYQQLSRKLSEAKAARYDANAIRRLNFEMWEGFDHSRECSECHRSDLRLDEDEKCTLCSALGRVSASLVDKDVFVVEESPLASRDGLVLPFGCKLRMYAHEAFLKSRPTARRVYIKNDLSLPGVAATHIWMGDYSVDTGREGISAYATQSATLEDGLGIQRLGVLRADVDNLGATFVSGIPNDRISLSRTSTLSRALSYFFKSKINDVLRDGDYQVQIIYSGGDDLFLIGNWCDVIYAAIDLRKALDAYTGNGSLSISGGIGMYTKTYPIARMATETGKLEDAAKNHPKGCEKKTKNAIALWTEDAVFGWGEFIGAVEPRMREVRQMFEGNEKGNAFIYRLVALLRDFDDVASAPRLAYLLARSFEDDQAHGSEASRKLYAWAQDPTERRCLIAAMEWYVCSIREGSEA